MKCPWPCFGRKINAPFLYSNHKGLRLPPRNRAPSKCFSVISWSPWRDALHVPACDSSCHLELALPSLLSCSWGTPCFLLFLQPAWKPSDPPLPVQALEWLLFSWLQGWVYDLGLANKSSPSPRSSDWFEDGQGAQAGGREIPWHFTGHAGREAHILSTGHALLVATLPLRGASLWNHLGKNRAKRRRTWTSFRPLGQPYNWNQPIPDLCSPINQCILFFFFSLSQLNWVVTGAKNHNWIICLAEQLCLYSTPCQVSFELFWWFLPFTCLFREIYNLQPKEVAAIPSILPLVPTSSQNASHFSHLHQFIAENAHRHGAEGLGGGCLQEQGLSKLAKVSSFNTFPAWWQGICPLSTKSNCLGNALKRRR